MQTVNILTKEGILTIQMIKQSVYPNFRLR